MKKLLPLFLLLAGTLHAEPLVKPDDTIALAGGANLERTRFYPWLQTQLVAAFPDSTLRVRNFGWEGDTVFEQWRDGGDVEKLDAKRRESEKRIQEQTGSTSWRQQRDWNQQLSDAGATVVLAQFGQMESLAGPDGLPAFVAAYETLIAEFAKGGRRVILLEPVPFEKSDLAHGPDLPALNTSLATYTLAIRAIAEKLKLPFVPLTVVGENRPALTENGFHLSETGHRFVARRVMEGLGLAAAPDDSLAAAHREMREFERLWFDYWRPMNWAFLTGDRTNVPYSRDWKDNDKRLFPEEMQEFLPLLEQAEANVRAALAGKPVTPIPVRSSIPVEPPTAKPQSPEEQLATFQVMDGFAVNLFASEADGIVKPVQMRWDERGRLWVACSPSYPQIKPGEKANDYVLVCEDTDHDGKADKFHKFVEGLFMPAGIELGDGGLYVAQGTELLHFKDTDGDGKADSRRLLMGGFGTADSHQMINCINWGFGGELWFSQGHHIYSRVETPYGVETLNRAGIWRYRPRTGHLDPFFQWSSAGANCWGVVTTRYGQPFHKSGANIGAYYSTPGLVRSNLAVDARALNLCLAPIKQVGMEILESSHFPEEMQGRIIIGGYYGNTLEQHRLDYDEKTGLFSTELLPNLIETKNNVFRPIEVRVGPDGALYVVDWYNPIIGHYQASYRHPDRDKAHGRIWRVTAKGRPLIQPSSLADLTVPDLLDLLDSPERWAASQAKRLLFEKDSGGVVAALDVRVSTLKADDPNDEYLRLQALSLYEAHETQRPDLLKSLLRSPDAKIRAYATRTLSTWVRDDTRANAPNAAMRAQAPDPNRIYKADALVLLETQIADPDPLVRLEAIVACSYVEDSRAATIAARALDHEFNDYHRHALTKTLHATNAHWAPLLTRGFEFDRDEHLLFALNHSWVENNPDDLKNLSGGAVDYRPQAASDEVRTILRQQVEKFKGTPERELVWLQALAARASVDDLSLLLERGFAHPALLAAIQVTSVPDPAALLAPLWASDQTAVQREAVRLSGLWQARTYTDRIREMAFDESAPLRAPAFEALLVLDPEAAIARQLERLRAVTDAKDAAPLLSALLAKAEGRTAFEKALATPDVLPATAARHVLNALNQIGRADAKLSPPLMKLAGLNTALPAYTKEYVTKVVKDARTYGDPVEGKKIYETAGCIACHIPGAAQSKIGPDLSAISRGLPVELIVTELVWPALNVKEGYEAATVTLKDGTVVTGFKQTETAEAIAVRDLATGAVRSIPRGETKEVKLGGTVMPDGLTAGMDERQLAHLVRYLMGLGE
jgi:putative heme-binding domain-containing protein